MATRKESSRRKRIQKVSAADAAKQQREVVSAQIQADGAAQQAQQLAQAQAQQVLAQSVTPIANDNNDPSYVHKDDPMAVAVNDAAEQRNKYFADLILEKKAEIDAEKAEREAEIQKARQAARWTGGTEAVNALVNLIGVGAFQAAPQPQKTYSVDWMRRADELTRENRERIRQSRERLRDAQGSLVQSQIEQRSQMQAYQQNKEQRDYERAMNQLKFNYGIQKDAAEAAQKSRQTDIDAYKAETDRMKAVQSAGEQESVIRRNNAQAGYYQARAAAERKGDKDTKKSGINVVFPGTNNGEDEVLTFANRNNLLDTVAANMDLSNWSENDQVAVENIIRNGVKTMDQKIDDIMPYLAKSPRMMELVRQAAVQDENAPAAQVKPVAPAGSPQAYLDETFGK